MIGGENSHPVLTLLHFGVLSRIQSWLHCFGCLEQSQNEREAHIDMVNA
jgi:hypothetical protein